MKFQGAVLVAAFAAVVIAGSQHESDLSVEVNRLSDANNPIITTYSSQALATG